MGKYTDIVFKVGDKEFPAHKAIASMLDAQLLVYFLEKKRKRSVIPIADIEEDVF